MNHQEVRTVAKYDKYYRANVYFEGYWREDRENTADEDLPYPLDSPYKPAALTEFIENLKLVESHIYRLDGSTKSYMGYSQCRHCRMQNGSDEYCVQYDTKLFVAWPNGLCHYYEAHNVVPSKFFYDFITGLAQKAKELPPLPPVKELTDEEAKEAINRIVYFANAVTILDFLSGSHILQYSS